MTAALSENWMARLRAITGISNLAITKPVRMPDDANINGCHNIRSKPVTITPQMLCMRVKKTMMGQWVLM